MGFERRFPIRFDDIDHGGIVYHPTFLRYCHWTLEDFFAECLRVPYASVMADRRLGFPTVRLAATFSRPLRFGNALRILLTVDAIGDTSVNLRYRGFDAASDALCVEVTARLVCLDVDRFKSCTIPDDLRQGFADHIDESATDATGSVADAQPD